MNISYNIWDLQNETKNGFILLIVDDLKGGSMVRFITAQDNNISVENIMEDVNNYINLGNIEKVSNSSQLHSIQQEYKKMFEQAEYINRDYMLALDFQIDTKGKFSKLKSFVKRIIRKSIQWYIRDIVSQQTQFNADITRYINQELYVIKKMDMELDRLKNENRILSNTLKTQNFSFPDEWYIDFENRFRGDTSVIKQRLQRYLDLFRNKSNIVDLGCGRGEFLSLLSENNILGHGIDINGKMVEECVKLGLDVKKQDCISFLEEQEKESLGGLFTSQLVEHLSKQDLYKMFQLSFDKLQNEGILVIETVNPLTLGVFCYGFYIDPTHTFPIHPAMLRFMAEKAGFEVEPIEFLNNFSENYRFNIHGDMNHNELEIVNKLNEQLYGAQDYCLICRKRGSI